MFEPRYVHWVAIKHVLRYLPGTVGYVGYGLRYVPSGDMKSQGYADSDREGVQWTKREPWGVGSDCDQL